MPSVLEVRTLLLLCLVLGKFGPWGKLSRCDDFGGNGKEAFGGDCGHMGEGWPEEKGTITHLWGSELTLQIFILPPQRL